MTAFAIVIFTFTKFATKAPRGLVGLFATLLAVFALSYSFGLEKTISRWNTDILKEVTLESGRGQLYKILADHFFPKLDPWGSGPGTFEKRFDVFRKQSTIPIFGRWDHAHSDPLQAFVEWGITGTMAWLAITVGGILAALGKVLTAGKSYDKIMIFCVILSILGVLLHSCVDFPLQISSLQLLTACICGIAWSRKAPASDRKT